MRVIGSKDLLADLRRMARGKEPKSPACFVAERAARFVKDGIERDDTAQLFRMFQLPDTRPDA